VCNGLWCVQCGGADGNELRAAGHGYLLLNIYIYMYIFVIYSLLISSFSLFDHLLTALM